MPHRSVVDHNQAKNLQPLQAPLTEGQWFFSKVGQNLVVATHSKPTGHVLRWGLKNSHVPHQTSEWILKISLAVIPGPPMRRLQKPGVGGKF